MARFEPLGSDCEFDTVRRAHNVHSPALFKPTGLTFEPLISALERRMVGFGDPQQVQITETPERKYKVHELQYELIQFVDIKPDGLSLAAIHERECKRWRFLADKLLEDLASGEKIFVYKQKRRFTDAEIKPLFRALRLYGPNSLLWIGPAEDGHPAGSVEQLEEGLMRGYLGRFFDYSLGVAHIIDGWNSVCREAWRIQSDRLATA